MKPILGSINKVEIVITKHRAQEVVDKINKGCTCVTLKHFMECDFPKNILLEIAEGTWSDADVMYQILDQISQQYVKENWPVFGDGLYVYFEWQEKMRKAGLMGDESKWEN